MALLNRTFKPLVLGLFLLPLLCQAETSDALLDPINYYESTMLANETVDDELFYEGLNTLLESSLATENYKKALVYAETLYAFGQISEETYNQVYLDWTKNIAQNLSPGVALTMLNNYINLSLVELDDLNFFLDLALENNSLNPLQLVIKELEARGATVPARATDAAEKSYENRDWVNGSVMIKIRQGYTRYNGAIVPKMSLGSGFFIDKKGYIITNFHVLAPFIDEDKRNRTPASISISLANNPSNDIPAKLVGYSSLLDLAILQTSVVSDYIFSFSLNDQAELGETVFAIGSPGGFYSTLTRGLVSNESRSLMPLGDVIQVDAPINPGNSGGPLVNEHGDVLGIVFAGIDQFEGINFALPANLVLAALPKLLNNEDAAIPFLGLGIYDWNNGQEICFVKGNSLLTKAGIIKDDLLLSLAGKPASTLAQYQKNLLKKPIGALINLGWQANSENYIQKTAFIKIEKRPTMIGASLIKSNPIGDLLTPAFGVSVSRIDKHSYTITKVYQGTIASQNYFSKQDVFTLRSYQIIAVPEARTDVLVLSLRSIIRNYGLLEPASGLSLTIPFNQNLWL